MSAAPETFGRGPSMRLMELVVAALLVGVGGVVIWGSVKVGIGWASDGPRAGYFPFYVGLLIVGSSLVTFVQAALSVDRRVFVTGPQFMPVLAVLIPSLAYVAAIGILGIYFSSMAFIGYFMWWIGKERGWLLPAIALGAPVAVYIVFERWFLVSLPKGPVELWLGL
ncbi:MAG: tripartite tricarboxylate transporter TctB family protein [Alphaproteobacteria bacterium]|nr:tripartite tricarboxylate transporter TctB family protein [Alphaproteobacteria bacterium]